MVRAGSYRHSVRFERRERLDEESAGDGQGNFEGQWQTLIDRRSARLMARSGDEEVVAGRAQGLAQFDLYVRSDTQTRQLTEGDRVVDRRRGDVFNILWVGNPDGRDEELQLHLQRGKALG